MLSVYSFRRSKFFHFVGHESGRGSRSDRDSDVSGEGLDQFDVVDERNVAILRPG